MRRRRNRDRGGSRPGQLGQPGVRPVSLDGTVVGTAPPTTPGVTALTGHTFASSGTKSSQDTFVIDDVTQT